MIYRTPITIRELIKTISAEYDEDDENYDESYCVYGETVSENIFLDSICYLDDYAEITDDDKEVFSDFVIKNKLELWYRDELIQDVISSELEKNPKATDERILEAIKYYNKHDAFME